MQEFPNNILAEKRLLSGALGSERVLFAAIERLRHHYFYLDLHQRIFKVMFDEKTNNLVRITQIIQDFDYDLGMLTCSYDGKAEIEQILECWQRRDLLTTIFKTQNLLFTDFQQKPEEISADLLSKLITGADSERKPRSYGELLPEQLHRIERIANGEDPAFFKTGFLDLDNFVSIQRDDYVIIGAAPSMGKSSLAGAIARRVARKTDGAVIIFSLESSSGHETNRALFTEAQLSMHQFNLGHTPQTNISRLTSTAGPLSQLKVYVEDETPLSPAKIFAKAQRIKYENNGNLKLIIVDFIQLMEADKQISDTRERINAISAGLKRVNVKLGCPLIACSQISRYPGMTKIPPQRHHLRESGNLEQDADIILLLYRPDYHNKNAEQKGVLDIYVAKQRNGDVGKIQLAFIKEQMRIENFSKEEREFTPHYASNI